MFTGQYTVYVYVYVYVPSSFFTVESPLGGSLFSCPVTQICIYLFYQITSGETHDLFKNPLCLGMEESEYKEMLALGGMRQKHFEKNEVILSAGCTTHEIGLVLSGSVNIENL